VFYKKARMKSPVPSRIIQRWVMRRTAVINQVRGLLLERGITLRKGRCHVDAAVPGIRKTPTPSYRGPGALRVLLAQLKLSRDHPEPGGEPTSPPSGRR
jgi:transposase